jgi:uncharacterized repeat protein (TIGR01451 family)
MVPINSKAGENIGYTLTVKNASGDNIDNVILEIPLDEGGNARYRVTTPIPAPENWTSEVLENDDFGYARRVGWWTDNVWAQIAASMSENFTFTATTPLYDGVYTWTCRTRDVSGYVDNDNITTRVDNMPPLPPMLVWPDNDENMSDNTPNLDWNPVSDLSVPVTYDLFVDNDMNFPSPEVDVTRITTDNYVTAELGEDTWYWKVRARDNAGNIGSWSTSRHFRVDITPPPAPTLLWPENGENINDNTPNLDWNPVIDLSMPVTYNLMYELHHGYWVGWLDEWLDENWRYRKQITVNHTKVDADLDNFPILISLSDSDLSKAQIDGDDILFTASDAVTKLNHEIESFDGKNLIAWVRIPLLSSSENTSIYMYYGNSGALNQENVEGVWNSNYVMVQHLNEGSGTAYDSTANNNDGAIIGATGVAGKVDNALDFVESDEDRVDLETNRLNGEPSVLDAYTIMAWVRIEGGSGTKRMIFAHSSAAGRFILFVNTSNYFELAQFPGPKEIYSSTTPSENTWHHITGVWDGSKMSLYVNGSLEDSAAKNDINTGTSKIWIGGNPYGMNNFFEGKIDEVEYLPYVALSDNWISTSYNNQSFPDTFYLVGSEQLKRLTDDNYQVTTELDEGIWRWKVRAVDNVGNIGFWSSPQSFRVDITPPEVPTLLAPDNETKTYDNTPTFRWTAITIENSLPVTYELQVDNDNDFSPPEVYVTGLADNTYTPLSELANGNYSWRVLARDNAGNASAWSQPWTLLINSTPHDATVTLIPVNSKPGISIGYTLTVTDNATGDNIDSVTLEIPLDENEDALYRVATPIPAPAGWTSEVPEIDSFGYARKVRWWTDNVWAQIAASMSENFTFTATTPLYDESYAWTCLTRDIIGYIDNDFLTTRVDNVPPDAPTLLEPANGTKTTDNTPSFRWMAVVDNSLPVTYTIQVDNNNDFSSPEINVQGLTDNACTSPVALTNDNYFWRVRATDNAGNLGPSSSTWTLLITRGLLHHDPIYINGNDDFTENNGVVGGSGAENDPYIVENWVISAENVHGIRIKTTTAYFVVRNCVVENGWGNFRYGIYLFNVVNGRIESNTYRNNDRGIYLTECSNNIIDNNTCENNANGIRLIYSDNNTLANNTCGSNLYGICIEGSNNTLSNNTCENNRSRGILLCYSDNIKMQKNTLSNNQYNFDVHGTTLLDFVHDIDTSNLVNGKPIRYLLDNKNEVIRPSLDVGYFGLVNCDNIRVENLTLGNNAQGILLAFTENSRVENCTVENNDWGIYLHYSDNNTLANNTCLNNKDGIHLGFSDNNTLSNNTCENNSDNGIRLGHSSNNAIFNNTFMNNDDGISLDGNSDINILNNNTCKNNGNGIRLGTAGLNHSNNNTLDNNTCENNDQYGIFLYYSDNNLVSNNILKNNDQRGINLYYSNNNCIYHNNIVNNGTQARDERANYWDNGYPSGGNYWGDYGGVDENRGENQDILGSDGIGDTPYDIPGDSNQDRYPLMDPWPVAHLGTATINLENLHAIRLEKNLYLNDGSKLVVKFYRYDNVTLQDNSVIDDFTPPHQVKEDENVPHPRGAEGFPWGTVQIVRLVLTTDNTAEVISTIASFTVTQDDLRGRYIEILIDWGGHPELHDAFRDEIIDILLQWGSAPW